MSKTIIHYNSNQKFFIDTNNNQINVDNLSLNAKVIILSGSANAPASPAEGQLYFDSISKNFSGYNGSSWVRLNN